MPALPALARYFRAGHRRRAADDLALSRRSCVLAARRRPAVRQVRPPPGNPRGLLLMVLSNVAGIFAETLPQLIAARIVQALGAAAGPAVGRAMIRDLYERDRAAVDDRHRRRLDDDRADDRPVHRRRAGNRLRLARRVLVSRRSVAVHLHLGLRAPAGDTPRADRPRRGRFPSGRARADRKRRNTTASFSPRRWRRRRSSSSHPAAPMSSIATDGALQRRVRRLVCDRRSVAYMAGNLTSARLTPKLGGHRMIWIGLSDADLRFRTEPAVGPARLQRQSRRGSSSRR